MMGSHDTTTVISANAPNAASRVAEVLRSGGIVATPTDTVYGLAAAVDNPDAIARLYALKHRPGSKAIPVLLADVAQITLVADAFGPIAAALANAFWPGPLTLVLPARPHLAASLTTVNEQGVATVAVRVPNHQLLREILTLCGGAAAVTSANISGAEPATNVAMVAASNMAGLDLIVDGADSPLGVPSTIVEIRGETAILLREGAVAHDAIQACLASVARTGGSDRHYAV